MAITRWYAPSLIAKDGLNLPEMPDAELLRLLQAGQNTHAAVSGPMSEVVQQSLQYWKAEDLQAMLVYLKGQPQITMPKADFLDEMLARKEPEKKNASKF